MQDLEGALTFMFKREIVIKKIIKGERLKAFEEFLDLLVKVGWSDVLKKLFGQNQECSENTEESAVSQL